MLFLALSVSCSAPPPSIQLEPVVEGLTQPTVVRAHGGVLVIAEQGGRLSVVADGKRSTWLDLATALPGHPVVAGGERGLLGFDLDPDYGTNGRVVLSWTAKGEADVHSVVASFRTTPGAVPGRAPLTHETTLLTVVQPWSNHNGGGVRFGPDGLLYIGLGDGGQAGDPLGSGQDRSTLLGAMLRLDPDLPAPHVPPSNPFVGEAGVRPEIFAYGLRNPWRFSFTPDGVLVAGDVGQNAWEEVTVVRRGGNHGWNVKEGQACYGRTPCEGDFVEPFFVYSHAEGFSVTGGVVVRTGALAGRYVFGDYGGHLWSVPLDRQGAPTEPVRDHGRVQAGISAFGLAATGDLLVVDHSGGRILRGTLVP